MKEMILRVGLQKLQSCRVYNTINDKNFEMIYEINANFDEGILSAVIFEDIFNEISLNNQIYDVS